MSLFWVLLFVVSSFNNASFIGMLISVFLFVCFSINSFIWELIETKSCSAILSTHKINHRLTAGKVNQVFFFLALWLAGDSNSRCWLVILPHVKKAIRAADWTYRYADWTNRFFHMWKYSVYISTNAWALCNEILVIYVTSALYLIAVLLGRKSIEI